MPRPSTNPSLLRNLRLTIQFTQSEFALMVGVSAVSIKKIEGGLLALSNQLAFKIMVATGISSAQLMREEGGKLIDAKGKPYSFETFIAWNSNGEIPSDLPNKDAKKLAGIIETTLKFLCETKQSNLYFSFRHLLTASLVKSCEEVGVESMWD
jgi:transcriptional regulator with XRE-family HTH domain